METKSFFYLLLLYVCHIVSGDVIVRQINDTTSLVTFSDAAAGFGPSISDDGISGFIYNVMPRKACEPVGPPPDNTSVWIALISRDNCTFAAKVLNAESAGYDAVIIFNENGNDLVTMSGDGTAVHIPSVFVGEMDGKLLERDYCYDCKKELGHFIITIEADEYIFNPYLLWPFAVVVGTCFILMLVFILVKWCRDIRKRRKSRLSSKHLKKIPTKKFKKGDEYDVCAICLDDYEEGDKLRLLPCSHVYHTKCIDPWLTKNKRCCPICKRKVIPGDDPSSDSGSSDEGETERSERTPLLAGSSRGNNNNNRRSTFDNSGLPALYREREISRSSTQGQGHGDLDSSCSDQSDSEVGAVGGTSRVKLSKENLLIALGVPKTNSDIETGDAVANGNSQEEVVIETSQGSDNHGFVVDGEDEESDDEYLYPDDSDVVYSDTSKKDEKKINGVV